MRKENRGQRCRDFPQQVLEWPERNDREFEGSGKLEVGHLGFGKSDAIARVAR